MLEETPTGIGGYTRQVLLNHQDLPRGVAVDGSGDVFVTDGNHSSLQEETPTGTGAFRGGSRATAYLSRHPTRSSWRRFDRLRQRRSAYGIVIVFFS